jgi:hypothetical protein
MVRPTANFRFWNYEINETSASLAISFIVNLYYFPLRNDFDHLKLQLIGNIFLPLVLKGHANNLLFQSIDETDKNYRVVGHVVQRKYCSKYCYIDTYFEKRL